MAGTGTPPFRADHVGSLLRPPKLIAARERLLGYDNTSDRVMGGHDNAELRAIEDDCIREVVAMQEGLGLKGVTDGEYRRTFFHVDFLERIEGVVVSGGLPAKFHSTTKQVEFAPPRLTVGSKLKRTKGIAVPVTARYMKTKNSQRGNAVGSALVISSHRPIQPATAITAAATMIPA